MSEHSQAAFPLARSEDLAAETLGTETVVYDGLSQEAHYLSPVAATVFAAADGRTSPADMAAIVSRKTDEPVDVATVELALAELEERNLLVEQDDASGVSRREMLRKGALVGGAALAAPLVMSVATPAYGATASNPTNLSYVAMMFTCGSTAYRMKIGGDGKVECGSTFSTPGNGDCTLTQPSGTTLSESCLDGVFLTQDITSSPHTVTIHFPSNCKLRDYIVKCANNCQANDPAIGSSGASGPTFTAVGCP